MICRELGRSGISVPAVAMGTWAIGGTFWGGTDERDSINALKRGLEEGMDFIDTAPAYGFGLAEELVGKAISGRPRDQLTIATKVGLVWPDDGAPEPGKITRNLRPESIRREIELSLRRLQTDYIDIYQTHWQDENTLIADTMTELLKLQEEGKIRAIGVSNASVAQMREYLAVGRIESNQPRYNMLDRKIEAEMLPFCREQGVGVLTYSSLSLGLLTGKVSPERCFPPGDLRLNNPLFTAENIVRVNRLLDRFEPFREKYNMSQMQLVIAWTISRPGVTTALVGVRNERQALELSSTGNNELEPEDLAAIDALLEEHARGAEA